VCFFKNNFPVCHYLFGALKILEFPTLRVVSDRKLDLFGIREFLKTGIFTQHQYSTKTNFNFRCNSTSNNLRYFKRSPNDYNLYWSFHEVFIAEFYRHDTDNFKLFLIFFCGQKQLLCYRHLE